MEQETYTTKQIAEKLQIGQTKAQEVMRAIKSISDILGIRGVVHKDDYEAWLAHRKRKR